MWYSGMCIMRIKAKRRSGYASALDRTSSRSQARYGFISKEPRELGLLDDGKVRIR